MARLAALKEAKAGLLELLEADAAADQRMAIGVMTGCAGAGIQTFSKAVAGLLTSHNGATAAAAIHAALLIVDVILMERAEEARVFSASKEDLP